MNLADLRHYVDDRADAGVFRVHRDIYTDPSVFELEMTRIFMRAWIFLGLESQLSKPHDYITTQIGRQPVVVMRDAGGRLGAFINSCRHKGAVVCHLSQGNQKYHTCRYHGWAYDSSGRNIDVKDRKSGAYAPAFDAEQHDLFRIPHFESYRGFMFGNFSERAPSLEQFLGDARRFIDLVVDQAPEGLELVPGRALYTFGGNWKLQVENGMDYYHLTSTHPSFMDIVSRRREGASENVAARAPDFKKRLSQTGGMFGFENGHAAVWLTQAQAEDRPLYDGSVDALKARVGATRGDWMLRLRNLTVFPNLQVADSTSLLLRTIHPLAVDRTEMRLHCLAPIGEPREVRAWRLRQFEDFFNASGLATPDDTTCYQDCQTGLGAQGIAWTQGQARGMALTENGPNDPARELGINPRTSLVGPFDVQNETVYHAVYRGWLAMMQTEGVA